MKCIQKKQPPTFYTEQVEKLQKELESLTDKKDKADIWSKLFKKSELTEYILDNEQNWLCGYCEVEIKDLSHTHLEHIEARSRNYDKNTFDYNNIIVSCNGNCHTTNNIQTCGHGKDKEYKKRKNESGQRFKIDYNRFINPVKAGNIRDFFIYGDDGIMSSSQKNPHKAKHTITALNLGVNNPTLSEERKKAKETFINKAKSFATKTKQPLKDAVIHLLNKENLAFISFLRFKYKDIL